MRMGSSVCVFTPVSSPDPPPAGDGAWNVGLLNKILLCAAERVHAGPASPLQEEVWSPFPGGEMRLRRVSTRAGDGGTRTGTHRRIPTSSVFQGRAGLQLVGARPRGATQEGNV